MRVLAEKFFLVLETRLSRIDFDEGAGAEHYDAPNRRQAPTPKWQIVSALIAFAWSFSPVAQ
ncbi:MAG: hypothetical protein JOY90_12195 [Bradyrhizobium sp.]|nr:hypothetical protein [Bradyrhizobium sp.]